MKEQYTDPASGAEAGLYMIEPGWWRWRSLNVPPASRGRRPIVGETILLQIVADADAEGVVLTLEPVSESNQERFEAWFERHGWYWCTNDGGPAAEGDTKCFMRRDPIPAPTTRLVFTHDEYVARWATADE